MMSKHLNPFKACTLICGLLAASPVMVIAGANETSNSNETASSNEIYVDSVYNWGAWELNIQPAAGGVPISTGRPLIARPARVAVNINSIAALSPVTGSETAPTIFAPTDTAPPVIINDLLPGIVLSLDSPKPGSI